MDEAIIIVPVVVIGLPWLILHYITKWKTSATLTNHDEKSLGDLHEMARYFEDRLETIERIIASERAEPINTDELSERRKPREIAHTTQLSDTQPIGSRSKERNF